MNKFTTQTRRLAQVAAATALVAAGSANAAAIDVGDVVTDIAAQATPVGLIGGAVLVLFVAIKAFRWVRSALG